MWNYYRDELTNDTNDNDFNKNVVNSKSFKYKTSIIGSTYVDENNDAYVENKAGRKDVEIVIPLKHLSNFW